MTQRRASIWQYLGSGYLNPGDMLLQPASKPLYAPPEKHCSICDPGYHNQRQPIV
jgi:hypothetical protein